MKATIRFDEKWIMQGGANSLAVRKAMTLCRKEYEYQVRVYSFTLNECVMDISTGDDAQQIKDRLRRLIIKEILGGVEDDKVFMLSVEKWGNSVKKTTLDERPAALAGTPLVLSAKAKPETRQTDEPPEKTETPEAETTETETTETETTEAESFEDKPTVLEQINALVGAAEFKALCSEIHARAEYILKNRTVSAFLSESYLFSVPAGGGYSSALKLMNDFLVDEKLLESWYPVEELDLPSPSDQNVQQNLDEYFKRMYPTFESPRINSIDLSDWVSHTGTPAFKSVLRNIARKSGESLVVFKLPDLSREQLKQTLRDIDEVLPTRAVEFKPYSIEETRELASGMLEKYGFTMEDSAWQMFDKKIAEEKKDGCFYGLYTIRKTVSEIIRCTELHCAANGVHSQTISHEAISKLVETESAEDPTGMEMLDALVGMEGIKTQITEIVTQILISRQAGGPTKPCMHMRFVGNAGTGKTTVARIIGKILAENGALRIGKFYEHRGRDLCGRYMGETAPKTTKMCQEAYGSVLFVDEAYSLYRGNSDYQDYGREAVDTLIAEMENNSDDLLVILAGYPEEMRTLMDANSGLKSRAPYLLKFPDYTREQLFEIFMSMISKTFTCTEELKECAKEYFLNLPDSVIKQKHFGNARFVRNIYERAWGKAGVRCLGNNAHGITMTAEDFRAAIDALEPDILPEEQGKSIIGF